MDKLYNKVKVFVKKAFTKKNKTHQIKHFVRTAYWVKQLKPDADEALLISAIAHDIERAFRKKDILEKKQKSFTNLKFLRPHEERGAEIIGKFLEKEKANKNLVNRVKMLISRHEEGGNEDQNLLKDADSISFFENNVEFFLKDKVKEMGKEKVKEKFDWMYNRITIKTAKQIAKPFYEKAIKALYPKSL